MAIGIDFERQAIAEGFRFVAGVDEVGRGCLAGAVVAAAVILDLSKPLPEGLNDSKKLSAKRRQALDAQIRENAVCYAIAQIEAAEIDRINILQATKKAMISAVGQLKPAADFLLIDAVQLKESSLSQKAIIHGDAISASIAAASISPKLTATILCANSIKFIPEYGFASHVGYGTKSAFRGHQKITALVRYTAKLFAAFCRRTFPMKTEKAKIGEFAGVFRRRHELFGENHVC
jgi:ribonuclease HII